MRDPLLSVVRRVAEGEEGALRTLYDATSARVYGIASTILGEHGLAEDAVVDVFSQVWSSAERFDPEKGSVVAWLTMLARSRALDIRRRHARNAVVEGDSDLDVLDPSPGPGELTEDDETVARVRRDLAELPAEQRRAIEASFFYGMSYAEVARAFEQPLGTVKTRIRCGLATLRGKWFHREAEAI